MKENSKDIDTERNILVFQSWKIVVKTNLHGKIFPARFGSIN